MSKNPNRCWCCGSKLVDSSRLLNTREGPWVRLFKPTGELVCPNQCPSKEQAEKDRAGGTDDFEVG